MSPKLTLSLIIIALLAATGLGAYFIWGAPATPSGIVDNTSTDLENAFPLGEEVEVPADDPIIPTTGPASPLPTTPEDARLTLVYQNAAPGLGVFNLGGNEVLFYLEKETGIIYQDWLADNTPAFKLERLTLPGDYQTWWLKEGVGRIRLILVDQTSANFSNNWSLPLRWASSSEELLVAGETNLNALPAGVSNVTPDPSGGSQIAFLQLGESETRVVNLSFPDLKQKTLLNLPLTEWLLDWPAKDTLTLATKPSADLAGLLYSFKPKTNTAIKLLSGINGLTALMSPDGQKILASQTLGGRPSLLLVDLASGQTSPLPLSTLANKCVWTADSLTLYCAAPQTNNTDNLWEVSAVSGQTEIIWTQARGDLDLTNLVLSPNGQKLFFTDRQTNYLWQFDLSESF